MISRLSKKNGPFKRLIEFDFDESQALILFGPRKTGKSTLLRQRFPQSVYFDLLKSDVRAQFQVNPSLLRDYILESPGKTFVIDEIQKVPELLDEVHWCIENTEAHFILCGSSVRKLKRGAANLLGGRALRMDLFPLVSNEIPRFDLERGINHGLIPQHYLSTKPDRYLKAYIEQYLQEEIIEEARIRKLQSFNKFLEVASLMNGELLNYANVASECGVSPKSVREYYQILEDTLLGFTLNPWVKVKTRKLIETAKFYLFDTGVIRSLKGLDRVFPRSVDFGNLFETFLINEVRAYLSYSNSALKMAFWKTTGGVEVDLIIGNMTVAIEFKSTAKTSSKDLKGLKVLAEEHPQLQQKILVCLANESRKTQEGIRILPYQVFLKELWDKKYF